MGAPREGLLEPVLGLGCLRAVHVLVPQPLEAPLLLLVFRQVGRTLVARC